MPKIFTIYGVEFLRAGKYLYSVFLLRARVKAARVARCCAMLPHKKIFRSGYAEDFFVRKTAKKNRRRIIFSARPFPQR
ncbi:MAG: hypothetical protein PW788_04770 [Micavibrio sp.]|nr:hypothetical protein [Micavibrio sp.]